MRLPVLTDIAVLKDAQKTGSMAALAAAAVTVALHWCAIATIVAIAVRLVRGLPGDTGMNVTAVVTAVAAIPAAVLARKLTYSNHRR